jgi:hypothetical protein
MWILGAIFFTVVILLVLVFCWALVTVADKPMPSRRAAKRRDNKAAGRVLSQAEFNQMYANGRPTMPSQVEPEDEFERRDPRHAAIQRMAQDAVDQGVYDKFVEGE